MIRQVHKRLRKELVRRGVMRSRPPLYQNPTLNTNRSEMHIIKINLEGGV